MKKTFWIFLDIDGVLNTSFESGGYELNSHCIEVLNNLYRYAHSVVDFKIVISSDWRTHFTLSQIQSIFNDNDSILIPQYYTSTSDLSSGMNNFSLEIERSFYIYDFIEQYGIESRELIILDDLDLSVNTVFPTSDLVERFIHVTNRNTGINDKEIIKKLYAFLDKFIMNL